MGFKQSQELIEQSGKRPSGIDLHKLWVSEVKPTNEWTYEVSKCSPQQAFRNLDEGFKRVFKVKGTKTPRFNKRPKELKIHFIWKVQFGLKEIELNYPSSVG